MNYNEFKKQSSRNFLPIGAGTVGNEILDVLDTAGQAKLNVLDSLGGPEWETTGREQYLKDIADDRQATKESLKPYLTKANLEGAVAGVSSGALAGGLTYAGLGLLPGLRKKRLVRAILALTAGVPVGLYTGHHAGRYSAQGMIDVAKFKVGA